MKNYRLLNIWIKGIELVKMVYQLTKRLPAEEKYGLISQLNRAAVSIPANIAEGNSRNSDLDNCRFLQIALGSAFEVQTYLVIIREMNWTNENELTPIENILESEIKMLQSFIRTLNPKATRNQAISH